ncbi:MAG: M43 family zinc metalloprotease [Ferruginibacter sp.]
MRRIFLVTIVISFVMPGLRSSSQNLINPVVNNYHRCYTVERIRQIRQTNPYLETDAQFETWLSKEMKAGAGIQRPAAANYTIPIIFHIVHNGEALGTSPNLDAALIQEQLLQLNKDFSNASNSRYASAAATGIQFVLAQRNPTGSVLTEPGIDRINRNTKGWSDYSNGWQPSYIDAAVKPNSTWDANRYYNVWIVPKMDNGTTDLLGYSTFPATAALPDLNNSSETANTAGVVILTNTVGSAYLPNNCNTGYGLGKTLAHESGHFLGLRHIWGDTDCGNDYCNDTPIHFTINNGVPTHPKSNSCGTPDEMFENYMDYSDDIVLNTFTANQVDRMQTVMLNSPRRSSLNTSNVGGVTVTGTNRVSFINCSGALNVSEKGVNNTYPIYKDESYTLNVEDKATGSATVTITTSGTAVNGLHYQLLTPSLVFAAGDNFKPVNIRIFDNPRVDGDKTIILNYTISGTGVAAGASAQTLTVTLLDDDNMRVGENTINLLNEHFENPTGARGLPAGWTLLASSGYVNTFVASTNGDAGGSGLSAHITNNIVTKPNTYTKGVAGAAVLQSPVIDASSVLSLGNLSFKYKVRGLEEHDEGRLAYTSSAAPTGPFYNYGATPGDLGYGPYSSNTTTLANIPLIPGPATLSNRKFNICFLWQTDGSATGNDPGFNVDDITLSATPFHIETEISSGYPFDIQSGTAVSNFKSTNNKALVTVRNASANISGAAVQIIQAGNGNVAFNTTAGAFMRTQKVYQITPASASPAVTYQATFYFTAAELAVWGSNRLNLKILKVQDGVSLDGTLTSSNSEIIAPTVVEDAAGGYISYSGNFTGFSQFMLVSPLVSLPATLTDFEVSILSKNIQLLWNTSQEINNLGFNVERSLDGVTFTKVGWVDGKGTTSNSSTYRFTDIDVRPDILYYYRIGQVDVDNRQTHSAIRSARLKADTHITIAVNPNPAKGFVNILINGTSNKASVELMNSLGQKLLRLNNVIAVNGVYKLPLSDFPKGTYTVVVYLPEGIFSKKIIIE